MATCGVGFGVLQMCLVNGTDTICEQCDAGKFSDVQTTTDVCTEFRSCPAGYGLFELGSSESDVQCEQCFVQEFTSIGVYNDVDDMQTPCENCTQCVWQCSTETLGKFTIGYCPNEQVYYVGASCSSSSD